MAIFHFTTFNQRRWPPASWEVSPSFLPERQSAPPNGASALRSSRRTPGAGAVPAAMRSLEMSTYQSEMSLLIDLEDSWLKDIQGLAVFWNWCTLIYADVFNASWCILMCHQVMWWMTNPHVALVNAKGHRLIQHILCWAMVRLAICRWLSSPGLSGLSWPILTMGFNGDLRGCCGV